MRARPRCCPSRQVKPAASAEHCTTLTSVARARQGVCRAVGWTRSGPPHTPFSPRPTARARWTGEDYTSLESGHDTKSAFRPVSAVVQGTWLTIAVRRQK